MHILKIIHGYPPNYNAGSEVYSQSVCNELSKHYKVSVFTREENLYAPDFSIRHEKQSDNLDLYIVNNPQGKDGYRHKQMDDNFSDLLKELKPDIAYIGHPNHLSIGLIDERNKQKIPIVFMLHDYWLMCPRSQFLTRSIVKENEEDYDKEFFGEVFLIENEKKTVSTNICLLVTDYINKPIYKVLFKEIDFVNKDKKFLSKKGIDGKYQEHTLNRDYNCMGVNLPLSIEETKKLFQEDTKIEIELEIISIFNVQFTVRYEITIGPKKNTSKNPDKKKFKNLQTYLMHHSIYRVEEQEIVVKKK
ncbi:hypothetical protein FACS1894178_2120 [Bacteroidia bacterium]|nr:hypothetical protein FACS1894178_2120 [Bacteroidia bacterium]